MTTERYHYSECGLDDVYLANGFRWHDTPEGSGVAIDDVEGLHRAPRPNEAMAEDIAKAVRR